MPETELLQFIVEGSYNPATGKYDQRLVLPRSMILQKNSGGQTVYPDIMYSLASAKQFKPPFREMAIDMAISDLGGILIISSEQGATLREFNTSRGKMPVGEMTGQPATDMDRYFLGKDYLKNNPHSKQPDIVM